MLQSVRGDLVYTGDSVLEDAYVSWDDQGIVSVGGTPQGELLGEYAIITPAFVDPHSHIGLIRSGEPQAEAEANDKMDSVMAHADVLDSVQMDDDAFARAIEAGVLYSCVLPGSGNIIGGQSALIRNYGRDTNSALIRRAGIKAAFGYNPMGGPREWKGTRPWTRMGALSILRAKLHDVRQKMAKEETQDDADVTYTAEETVLKALLTGQERLRVHVHKSDDIAAVLRFVDEFRLNVTMEHTCDVHDEATYSELARRGIPVVYGPMDSHPYKVELKHENWRNIRHLIASGVTYGLMTDHPVVLQEGLLLQLRWFLRVGLSRQQALEIITRQNAEIVGLGDLVGTLAPGKWASCVCWSGDPFSLESHPAAVYAEGDCIVAEGA